MGQRKNDPHQTLEALERWSAWATLVIFIGIVVEIVSLLWLPHNLWERMTGTVANVLIGAGLLIEYVVILRAITATNEANRLSDEKVAESIRQAAEATQKASEAEARASEAQLALEKFKTPRSLSTEQQERVTAKMKLFAGMPFDFSIQPDQESIDLMGQIGSTLKAAGLSWEQWHGKTSEFPVYTRPGIPRAGIIAFTGLMIQIDDTKTLEWGGAVEAIWAALNAENVKADRMRIIDGTETPNAIHIYIGRKPQ